MPTPPAPPTARAPTLRSAVAAPAGQPRAERDPHANSRRRFAAWLNCRLATLTHAISSTSATAPSSVESIDAGGQSEVGQARQHAVSSSFPGMLGERCADASEIRLRRSNVTPSRRRPATKNECEFRSRSSAVNDIGIQTPTSRRGNATSAASRRRPGRAGRSAAGSSERPVDRPRTDADRVADHPTRAPGASSSGVKVRPSAGRRRARQTGRLTRGSPTAARARPRPQHRTSGTPRSRWPRASGSCAPSLRTPGRRRSTCASASPCRPPRRGRGDRTRDRATT